MAYKDRDKQREAVRQATRRYRERKQDITRPIDIVIPVIPPKPYAGELTKARQVGSKGFNETGG